MKKTQTSTMAHRYVLDLYGPGDESYGTVSGAATGIGHEVIIKQGKYLSMERSSDI